MSTIDIEEIKLKDKEYSSDTDFTDVVSGVDAVSLSDVEGPTVTPFTDISGPTAISLSDIEGPAAISFSDVVYNVLVTDYVTNVNTFQFASIPFNDVLTFEE